MSNLSPPGVAFHTMCNLLSDGCTEAIARPDGA